MENDNKEFIEVRRNGNEIRNQKNPSVRTMKEAVKKTPSSIKYIENPPFVLHRCHLYLIRRILNKP